VVCGIEKRSELVRGTKERDSVQTIIFEGTKVSPLGIDS